MRGMNGLVIILMLDISHESDTKLNLTNRVGLWPYSVCESA
jgi:hypothetical protein